MRTVFPLLLLYTRFSFFPFFRKMRIVLMFLKLEIMGKTVLFLNANFLQNANTNTVFFFLRTTLRLSTVLSRSLKVSALISILSETCRISIVWPISP